MKDSSTSATERVGRYQLLEPIGGGPNGSVSRAKVFGVAGFERQFAVKRFVPELTVGAIAQALSAAARSYGSLEHPRIARMSEFGVAQGQTFTAVELVAGLDAARLMAEAKIGGTGVAAGGALALVSQAARAVGYAHGRGLSHLGLSPTNVIVTADGDVKVTDFGILAATMPPRPVEVQRLAPRIPYLAPEQLAGEATSAATDVFVLGVIAYELVTGQRAYRGETPAQIAQAIQAGPPAEPPLPRPIVRVLQRCLARSPFERFPDARALADALDAALRVAPVPGTRKDIGAQVKSTLDRYATLNEGNLSGMVAMNLQTAPLAHHPPLDAIDISTQPFMRSEARTEPSPVLGSDSPHQTFQELPKPFNTVAGLAPPPIPVPPGVTPPPSPAPPPSGLGPKTMLGISPVKKGQIPSIVPPIKKPNGPAASAPPPPPPARRMTPPPMPAVQPPPDEVIDEPSGLIDLDDSAGVAAPSMLATPPHAATSNVDVDLDDGRMPADDPATVQGPPPAPMQTMPASSSQRLPKPTPGDFESRTGEMSPIQVEQYSRRSVQNTQELAVAQRPNTEELAAHNAVSSGPAVAGEFSSQHASMTAPPYEAPVEPAIITTHTPPPPRNVPAPSGNGLMIVVTLVLLAALGVGGYFVYTTMFMKPAGTKVAGGTGSAVVVADKGSAESPPDKGSAGSAEKATPVVDTGSAEKGSAKKGSAEQGSAEKGSAESAPDKGSAEKGSKPDKGSAAVVEKPKPTKSSDSLQINSKPAGARVFIDGADQGVTPLKLPGSSDRHTMAVLLPGHDLYVAEVDGHGVFDVSLKPVTPSGGHAGIKVLKCKAKERYYVYVDGKPTGMTCPTERIDTVVGPHTVEVYDIVTETRRKFDVNVKDERLSARVRIDD